MKLLLMERQCALNSWSYLALRTVVLAVALIVLLLSVWGVLLDRASWPLLVGMVVLCAALAFERRHYGAALRDQPDGGWLETEEQFIDDASGELVRVWYNAATGERRYVAVTDAKSN
jgi:hypothetical protein